MNPKTRAKVIFIVPPQAHLLDISGPAQIFYEAIEYGANFSIHFVSPFYGQSEIPVAAGTTFGALHDYKKIEASSEDFIFLPGMESSMLLDSHFMASLDPFFEWLRKKYQGGARICSVCTGSFLLAESGLLNGKTAATHWKLQKTFSKKYPKVEVLRNRLFVHNERLYCSAGMLSGIDMSLYIVQQLCGASFAALVAREVLVYFRRGEEDEQISAFLQYRNHINDAVHKTQDWLSEHLNKKFTLKQLGEIAHVSPRHLTRTFKIVTGITIGSFVNKLRVEHATQLLKEGAKVNEVAKECGLKSANQLRQILKRK